MDDRWITVPNWTKFQHYKDRSPSWIKVYTELNSRDEWLRLTWGQRGVLVTTWLEYARASAQLAQENVRRLGPKSGSRYFQRDFEALNHAGFIVVSASTEEVLRTSLVEATTPRASAAGVAAPRGQLHAAGRRFAAGWTGTSSDAFEEALDELEQLAGARFTAGERYDLWDQANHSESTH